MFAQLTNLGSNIFWLSCHDTYTLGMLCWRVQETFDGVWCEHNEGRIPNLVEYMEWYVQSHGKDCFTYPDEWEGYNIAGRYLREVYGQEKLEDANKYDDFMVGVLNMIEASVQGAPFCLIAAVAGDMETLRHELAHAFWELDPVYKSEMTQLISQLDHKHTKVLKNNLHDLEYASQVYSDETQAYCAAGQISVIGDGITKPVQKRIARPFEAVLREKLSKMGFNELFERCKK